VCVEASTKPHVHQKFEIFWTNTASTMACPNFKNGPKNGLHPLGVKFALSVYVSWASRLQPTLVGCLSPLFVTPR
jgi:hypothetical protein